MMFHLLQVWPRWCVLTLLGVAVLLTLRLRYTNLGVSGQLIASAIVGAFLVRETGSPVLGLAACVVTAVMVGIACATVSYATGASEILVTLFVSTTIIKLGQMAMIPAGGSMLPSTPDLPIEVELQLRRLAMPPDGSLLHLAALFAVIAAWWALGTTALGYRVRALEANPSVVDAAQSFRLTLTLSAWGGLLVGITAFADALVVYGKYVNQRYDATGFVGLIVALLAGRRAQLVPVAALIVALLEHAFVYLSVDHGVPAHAARVIMGAGVLVVLVLPAVFRKGGQGAWQKL